MDVDINSWERMFQTLLQQEEPWHRWTLRLDEMIQPDRVANGWKQYQQKAFGRFQCSSCSRAWASAKVQVLCHMNWNLQTSQGQVLMRFFAQRCKKCQLSQFEKPTFSSESTSTILNNLVQRILERFYGQDLSTVREVPVVAEVPLNGSHDTANCEACVLGFCKHGLQDPLTSFSYLDIGNFLPTVSDVLVQNRVTQESAEVGVQMSESSRAMAGTQGYELTPQTTSGAVLRATHRSGTSNTSRAEWSTTAASAFCESGHRMAYGNRRAPGFPPPNNGSHQNHLKWWFKWGTACVVVVCLYFAARSFTSKVRR